VNATQIFPQSRLRSVAAATGIAASILLTGACQSTNDASTITQVPSAGSSADPAAAVAARTMVVCAAINQAKAQFFASAMSSGGRDTNKALVDGLTTLSTLMKAQVPNATDPALRAALEETAAAADAYAAAPNPAKADDSPFAKAGSKLDKACKPAAPAPTAGAATATGNTVGGTGTACELPVSFELAKSWKPKAVTVEADNPLAELVRKGPLSVVCEIDAKPAGHLGFIRVWGGANAKGTPRDSLTTFLKGDDVRKPVYTDITVGGQPGVEIVYGLYSKLMEETRQQRAFAVQTPAGAVIVALGGLDSDENGAMLPAYELAKRTLVVNP
jgi:hypothetical protein